MDLQDAVTPPTVAFNFPVLWLLFIDLKSHCVGGMGTDEEFGSQRREMWVY